MRTASQGGHLTPRRLIEPARHAGVPLLRTQSDERLVDLVRDGNDRAFEAIVDRYRRPLLRYCVRLLPPTRAEDAVQQTFLSAFAAIRRGDAELQLRPWLYRIAHNTAVNLLRQNGWNHEELDERIDGVETPPEAVERGERLRTVIAALGELPERQRAALVLRAIDGRSYDEIASELGVTGGAVRQLLNRARNTLRAGATALTPPGLLARVVDTGDSGFAAVKLAAAVVAAGAVVGGATQIAPSHHPATSPPRHGHAAREARDAAVAGAPLLRLAADRRATGHGRSDRDRRSAGGRHSAAPVSHRHAPTNSRGGDGDRHGGSDDGSSTFTTAPTTDDHSGSGSGSGGGGSDDGMSGSSNSGPGSTSMDSHDGSSGSSDLSGTSGTSGSGDTTSGTSGDGGGGTSGSGSSGSSTTLDTSSSDGGSSGSSGSSDGGG